MLRLTTTAKANTSLQLADGLRNSGSCMLTLMGIAARRLEIDLKGTRVEIQKVMAAEPRRIAEIRLDFYLPGDYSDKDKKILQGAAETCPRSANCSIPYSAGGHLGLRQCE